MSGTCPVLRINFILGRAGLAGGVKSNRLIAEALVRRGHDVRLVFLDGPPPRPSILRPRRFLQDLRRHRMPGPPAHHLLQSEAQLIPVRDKSRIDAADAPAADVSIAGFWRTRLWIENWPADRGMKAYFVRGYETFAGPEEQVRATYRLPGLRFVTSTWLERLLNEEFGGQVVRVPNGVDCDQFDAPRRGKGDPPVLGFLYSQATHKDPDTAFAVAERVAKVLPRLRVVAFGRDPLAAQHRDRVNLEYHLRPSQDRIPRIYRAADAWLVPSRSEGFGMPGLEAAACRCPLVSTRCGGPEDYVRAGENGYLADVGDVDGLADAVLRALTARADQWQAMSDASYAISHEFDWDQSAAILEASLLAALGEGRKPAHTSRPGR